MAWIELPSRPMRRIISVRINYAQALRLISRTAKRLTCFRCRLWSYDFTVCVKCVYYYYIIFYFFLFFIPLGVKIPRVKSKVKSKTKSWSGHSSSLLLLLFGKHRASLLTRGLFWHVLQYAGAESELVAAWERRHSTSEMRDAREEDIFSRPSHCWQSRLRAQGRLRDVSQRLEVSNWVTLSAALLFYET